MKVLLRVKDIHGEVHETYPSTVSPSVRKDLDEMVSRMGRLDTFSMNIKGRERFFNPATLIYAEVVEVFD